MRNLCSVTNTNNKNAENILLVGTELDQILCINQLIKRENYNINFCGNVAEAEILISSGGIDLVLIDLKESFGDTFNLLKFIKANDIDTSAIVLGDVSYAKLEARLLEYGAHSYLQKPYTTETLVNTVKNTFIRRELEYQNQEMHMRLLKSEKLHQHILNKSPDIVYMLDNKGRFTFVNRRMQNILGYSINELIGKHYSQVIYEDDMQKAENIFNERRTGARSSSSYELRLKCNGKCNHERYFNQEFLPISINAFGIYKDSAGTEKFIGTYGIARDVSDRKKTEKIIHFQAYHDTLTRLPNRMLMKDRLEHAVSHAKRNLSRLAVMTLDLDRFKNVNDSLGHMVGDKLLQVVAERLNRCLRECDTLARIGGDEFTIILPEIKQPEDTEVIANKILEVLRKPFLLDEKDIFVTTSIGIAQYPEDGNSAALLLKHADMAMYSVKDKRKDSFAFYHENMDKQLTEHISMESDIRQALKNDQFRVHYQPQVDALTGNIIAVEALIRWDHPEKGTIEPARFIPFSEESGVIEKISEWMIESICKDLHIWKNMELEIPRIAVNISGKQFENDNVLIHIQKMIEKYHLSANMFEFEITESVLMKDLEMVIDVLNKLSSMGIKIAIDDFGTGYSSLHYIQKLPIDTLKIDKSFVAAMEHDEGAHSIITAVIAMAKGLNLHIISEGVEELSQMLTLQELGCTNMQGFLFSPPVDNTKITEMFFNQVKLV